MKKCVFFYNCMSSEIIKQLNTSSLFSSTYSIIFIPIYEYIIESGKYFNEKELINEHTDLLLSCDLLIRLSLRKNRGYLNFENIKQYLKKECICIKIPQYTFSGYHYPYNFIDDKNIDEHKPLPFLKEYINNLLKDNLEDIDNNLVKELEHIKNLDKISDIKCYDFIKTNYKNIMLFNNRSYATYHLFHYIAQGILLKLSIYDQLNKVCSKFGIENTEPILPIVYKKLELKFSPNVFKIKCNLLEYIICCKKLNTHSLYLLERKKGRKHCKLLNTIIQSKKFNYI